MSRPGKAKREARRQKRIAEGRTEDKLVPLGVVTGPASEQPRRMRELAANLCARARAFDRGDVSNTSTGLLYNAGSALAYAADRLDAVDLKYGTRVRLRVAKWGREERLNNDVQLKAGEEGRITEVRRWGPKPDNVEYEVSIDARPGVVTKFDGVIGFEVI